MSNTQYTERPTHATQDSVLAQARAADPNSNVFVSANAGSGKTYVLTRRVLRILLSGVAPQNVLCLTYTKAAAAEMQKRVAAELGKWALMSDQDLANTLHDLSGERPNAALVQRARTLFAEALETPGGLKIKTIHAFCEAVLHRFPLEADIPMRFSVIEEDERQQLLMAAKNQVLADGLRGDSSVTEASEKLFELFSDFQINQALDAALGARDLAHVLKRQDEARANLAQLLGEDAAGDLNDWESDVLSGCLFTQADAEMLFSITPPRQDTRGFGEKVAEVDWSAPTLAQLCMVFLTQKLEKTSRLATAAVKKQNLALWEKCHDEADRLVACLNRRRKIFALQASSSLLTVVDAVHRLYVSRKRARARLDFDDLIDSLLSLLQDKANRDWVRYKLDAQISHILVDESQDTNPDQWETVDKLIEEFFEGEGAVELPRSVFAVGDEKQSIYSFQGADPHLFAHMRDNISQRAARAQKPFLSQKLKTSFRTLDTILDAVDKVAQVPEIAAALLADADGVMHESARTHKTGRVTLWPIIVSEKSKKAELDDWPTKMVTQVPAAEIQLAERIVNQIAHWVESGRMIDHRDRAVRPDDVMILLQRRGTLYVELIKKLKERGLPTPGADILPVSTHIAVEDLLALTQFLQTPSDQLSLAAVLRSPLIGFSEEQLAQLAIGRDKASLWSRLEEAGTSAQWAQDAFEYLDQLRARLDFDRPYEFYARILYKDGGLLKFRARLGSEIDDVIDTFLDLALAHEQADQPSLSGFVRELKQRDLSIRRELSDGGGVRVMTVHGAKGLEAPIVILADAAFEKPDQTSLFISAPRRSFGASAAQFVYAPNKSFQPPEIIEQFKEPAQAANRAEYWRKLYVAMTRAEDELYITGAARSDEPKSAKWYQAVELTLGDQLVPHPLYGEDDVDALSLGQVPNDAFLDSSATVAAQTESHHAFAQSPIPEPVTQPRLISPSSASSDAPPLDQAPHNIGAPSIARIGSDVDPRARGTALHALLQYLGDVPTDLRENVARSAMGSLLADGSTSTHENIIAHAMRIFDGPDAAFLFGEGSRAEVPFVADGTHKGEPMRLNGRVDRMIMRGNTVTMVDYKSDIEPPSEAKFVGGSYVTQLGLYHMLGMNLFKDYKIDAGIYWTETESLMMIPSELLQDATKHYTLL